MKHAIITYKTLNGNKTSIVCMNALKAHSKALSLSGIVSIKVCNSLYEANSIRVKQAA